MLELSFSVASTICLWQVIRNVVNKTSTYLFSENEKNHSVSYWDIKPVFRKVKLCVSNQHLEALTSERKYSITAPFFTRF